MELCWRYGIRFYMKLISFYGPLPRAAQNGRDIEN